MMFCLQHVFRDVELCFDSTYTHGMATSIYNPNVHEDLVVVLAGIRDMLAAVSNVTWTHESSHEWLPYNGFADVTAKFQR